MSFEDHHWPHDLHVSAKRHLHFSYDLQFLLYEKDNRTPVALMIISRPRCHQVFARKLGEGSKYKIDNIEENNEVGLLQLHQYVIQIGWRQKQYNIYPLMK